MIEIKKATEEQKQILDINYNAFVCTGNGEILGFCEYAVNDGVLFISRVNCNDRQLCDGIIRQVMSYELDNGNNLCRYSDEVRELMYSLRIIKKKEQSELDTLDFFQKLNCC